ncbi:nuclear transport factor 2 family protein [Mycolicibacterium sp. lyk4-40-TYG-92]|uniref:nuclear transport factor 2 family protein n=1 Tax=Mycolicibacterium sp. lyk4-40-TYG-92 TaxID=3040295 RepID=UPI00254AB3E6|nr:nuclear transport factor 2 family protein [Mycolicibacterium sp. lyk4-40-TYG-92]
MTGHSLQTLSDRTAIAELSYRYSLAIDTKNFDALDDVFTPDAYVDYRAMGGIAGYYPEVKQWLRDTLSWFNGMLHITTNHIITVEDDEATGRSICLAPMALRLEHQKDRVQFYGLWYHDTYRRTSNGWRITTRREEKVLDYNT